LADDTPDLRVETEAGKRDYEDGRWNQVEAETGKKKQDSGCELRTTTKKKMKMTMKKDQRKRFQTLGEMKMKMKMKKKKKKKKMMRMMRMKMETRREEEREKEEDEKGRIEGTILDQSQQRLKEQRVLLLPLEEEPSVVFVQFFHLMEKKTIMTKRMMKKMKENERQGFDVVSMSKHSKLMLINLIRVLGQFLRLELIPVLEKTQKTEKEKEMGKRSKHQKETKKTEKIEE